jgi:hypothetical protein
VSVSGVNEGEGEGEGESEGEVRIRFRRNERPNHVRMHYLEEGLGRPHLRERHPECHVVPS